jgi:hypothetical protein
MVVRTPLVWTRQRLHPNWLRSALYTSSSYISRQDFGLNSQTLALAGITIVIVSIVIWLILGLYLGYFSLPGSQQSQKTNEKIEEFSEESKLVFNVVEGNWIKTLEGHAVGNITEVAVVDDDPVLSALKYLYPFKGQQETPAEVSPAPHYLCCPSQQSSLECYPHKDWHIKKQPEFKCSSEYVYDVSLNLPLLGIT